MRYHWSIPHDWKKIFNSISFFLKKSIHIYQILGGEKKQKTFQDKANVYKVYNMHT